MRLVAALLLLVAAAALLLVNSAPGPASLSDATSLMLWKALIWTDPYSALASWAVTPVGHACFWYGVKCQDTKITFRVTSITLVGLELQGPIGTSIGMLSELNSFNISNNGFSGIIPGPAVGNLSKLYTLDLSYNAFDGQVPLELGNLANLSRLYLGHNQFLGTLIFLDPLMNITELSLEYNLLNGYPFNLLLNLTNCSYVNLANNDFGGTINAADMTHWGPATKYLNFSNNQFLGPLPASIQYLTNLEVLDFGRNNMTGALPTQLSLCPKLKHLNGSYNFLSGAIPGTMNKLVNILLIDIRGNAITGKIDNLMKCKTLVDLRVAQNKLSGAIPKGFDTWTFLNYLDLSSNAFTGGMGDWTKNKLLKTLNLSTNLLSGPTRTLINSLDTLDISQNKFTGPFPTEYALYPNLMTLNVAFNNFSGTIPPNMGQYGKLISFNASGNILTGPIPRALSDNNLSNFDVSKNRLSGKIPDTEVMRRFNASAFIPGNSELCGKIIPRKCPFVWPLWLKVAIGFAVPAFLAALTALFMYLLPKESEPTPHKLRKMTQDFNIANIIGVGGSATVYRGVDRRFLRPNKTYAVKRLRPEYFNDVQPGNFEIERQTLLKVKHPNVVRVRGSCNNPNLKAFLLDHCPNGNVDMALHQEKKLPWNKRIDVAAGVAQGLAYLHGEWQREQVMNCDMKATSILLDNNNKAKITDVRLTKAPTPFVTSNTPGAAFCGPTGYTPPG